MRGLPAGSVSGVCSSSSRRREFELPIGRRAYLKKKFFFLNGMRMILESTGRKMPEPTWCQHSDSDRNDTRGEKRGVS